MITATDIEQILKIAQPISGEAVYKTHLGHGSMISLDFGAPVFPDEKRSRGKWQILVNRSFWRIELSENLIVGSEDSADDIERALKRLHGAPLSTVEILPPSLDTILNFKNGSMMKLFSVHSKEKKYREHWMLFTPDFHVLALGPGSRWTYEKDDGER